MRVKIQLILLCFFFQVSNNSNDFTVTVRSTCVYMIISSHKFSDTLNQRLNHFTEGLNRLYICIVIDFPSFGNHFRICKQPNE